MASAGLAPKAAEAKMSPMFFKVIFNKNIKKEIMTIVLWTFLNFWIQIFNGNALQTALIDPQGRR